MTTTREAIMTKPSKQLKTQEKPKDKPEANISKLISEVETSNPSFARYVRGKLGMKK